MKAIQRVVVFCLFLTFTVFNVYSQGCSDAGFCTIGNLKSQSHNDSVNYKQRISLILPVGRGDEDVFIFTPAIQFDNQLSGGWSIQAKLTANYASGNLGNATGLGDLFLAGTYAIQNDKPWKTSVTIGTKLYLNTGNLKEDGKSLPMQYQSSLGTIDLITGFSLSHTSWQFSAGWQQPLSGINRNNFLPVYWGTAEANTYPPSNDFNRKGDVLLRGAYMFTVKREYSFTVGMLGIYHLDEDTYIDANVSNEPISIAGSQGLTLNATIAGFWKVNSSMSLGFSAGVPLIVREVRPDGLTRSFVFAPEIRWNL